MGMHITYSGLESLIYEDLCKVVSAPLDLVMSQDADNDNLSINDQGVFQGSNKVINYGEGLQILSNVLRMYY